MAYLRYWQITLLLSNFLLCCICLSGKTCTLLCKARYSSLRSCSPSHKIAMSRQGCRFGGLQQLPGKATLTGCVEFTGGYGGDKGDMV